MFYLPWYYISVPITQVLTDLQQDPPVLYINFYTIFVWTIYKQSYSEINPEGGHQEGRIWPNPVKGFGDHLPGLCPLGVSQSFPLLGLLESWSLGVREEVIQWIHQPFSPCWVCVCVPSAGLLQTWGCSSSRSSCACSIAVLYPGVEKVFCGEAWFITLVPNCLLS